MHGEHGGFIAQISKIQYQELTGSHFICSE